MVKVFYSRIPQELDEEIIPQLSEYRQKRLSNMKSPKARKESICAEFILERAVYPKRLRPLHIKTTKLGKPYFENSHTHFNISHTDGWIACAIADFEIGLDIQKQDVFDKRVAERYFCPDELEYLNSSADPESAFYELWTKKESYVKALGTGLKQGLSTFSVLYNADIQHWLCENVHFSLCTPKHPQVKIEMIEVKLL